MSINDRIFLSNDSTSSGTGGVHVEENVFAYMPQVSETSALTNATSAQIVPVVMAKANGRVVDAYVGLAQNAVSASGFVSGYATANVRINSATCLSTQPAIYQATASAANNRARSNNVGNSNANSAVSAVVNVTSAVFSAGDMISIDYGYLSAGSAAAGLAATGIYVGFTLRYNAV